MDYYPEMLEWIQYTPEDDARLRRLWPAVEPRRDEIVGIFYERILANPRARTVFEDDAQIRRQQATLQVWMRELLLGPRDDAYLSGREQIGRVHVQVGLPARYMFTSMNVMREALCRVASESFPPPDAVEICQSVHRACDLDLAIMNSTYVQSREEQQMATLQELIVSQLPVTVLLLDADGRVTAATRPGARLFGERVVLHRLWQDALPGALIAAADLGNQLARAQHTHREIVLARVDVILDGQARNFRISLIPLDHPNARMLLHLEDLSDTIATEARLRRNESLAQLGALSAAVAHELRNPLAGISGAIQVIARSLPDSDRRKPIREKVEAQVRRLDALVTDLLDFARPTSARRVNVDLDELARSVVDPLRREHADLGLHCVGSGRALADPNLVQQILLNLVLNAIQALRGEDGALRTGDVWVEVSDGRIVVRDSGPGVPADNHERIFTPFFTTRSRGTGLGLAICRKAALAMGATLSLRPEMAMGACFVLDLPEAAADGQSPGASV